MVGQGEAASHLCEIGAFEPQLKVWLASAEGQFAVWLAERQRLR